MIPLMQNNTIPKTLKLNVVYLGQTEHEKKEMKKTGEWGVFQSYA